MAYSDKVIDHYNNPRNVGSLDKKDPNVGTGLVGAPECGDVMKLQIKINPETQVIEDARFKTFGCGSAIASSSLATAWLKGRPGDEVREQDGVKVFVDMKSWLYLNGATLDWKDEGWMQRGFPFSNPNSWGACGGGESFAV